MMYQNGNKAQLTFCTYTREKDSAAELENCEIAAEEAMDGRKWSLLTMAIPQFSRGFSWPAPRAILRLLPLDEKLFYGNGKLKDFKLRGTPLCFLGRADLS
jgi:hypothetical protein